MKRGFLIFVEALAISLGLLYLTLYFDVPFVREASGAILADRATD